MKLNAKELRDVNEKEIGDKLRSIKRKPIYFILENVYDTYNIGGIFRLADALCIEKLYLCGETETPPNSRIKKASIGTYKIVPWEYYKSVIDVIINLRSTHHHSDESRNPALSGSRVVARDDKREIKIIAVEQSPQSIPYTQASYSLPLVLIFGNETYGVTPETLKIADQIVEIPMWGINKSLNVIVSAAIVSYWITSKT